MIYKKNKIKFLVLIINYYIFYLFVTFFYNNLNPMVDNDTTNSQH